MKSLIINETDDSAPKIILDKDASKFQISGVSLPEDVIGFYTPVVKWIEKYITDPNPQTEFEVKLTYFNTSSSKAILDILTLFDKLTDTNDFVSVTWYYPEMDDDLLATGHEFKNMLKMPFTFISYVQ
jgi:hypothetical protein